MFLWLVAIAALVAVVLNIRRNVLCFWIWTATNAIWVSVDLYHEIYAQAALQAVYFGLSIYGIWAWRHDAEVVTA